MLRCSTTGGVGKEDYSIWKYSVFVRHHHYRCGHGYVTQVIVAFSFVSFTNIFVSCLSVLDLEKCNSLLPISTCCAHRLYWAVEMHFLNRKGSYIDLFTYVYPVGLMSCKLRTWIELCERLHRTPLAVLVDN